MAKQTFLMKKEVVDHVSGGLNQTIQKSFLICYPNIIGILTFLTKLQKTSTF